MSVYGFAAVGEAFSGIPHAPFGSLTPSAVAGFEVMHLAWTAAGDGFVAYFYLTDGGAAAPPDAFESWSFTDDDDAVWTFERTTADDPDGADFPWSDDGSEDVRGWQWTITPSDLPAVTEAAAYEITFETWGPHSTEHAHSASGIGLEVETDLEDAAELMLLHEYDPRFSRFKGDVWVTTEGVAYAEGTVVLTVWKANEFPPEQFAEITLGDVSGDASGGIGPGVRVTTAGGYGAVMDGTGVVHINKYRHSGLERTLKSFTPTPPLEAGDVLRIEAVDSTLTTKINDIAVDVTTDSDHPSGTIAVAGFGESALLRAPPPKADAFKGGNPNPGRKRVSVVPAGVTHASSSTFPAALTLDFAVVPAHTQHEHHATEVLLEAEVLVEVVPDAAEHAHSVTAPVALQLAVGVVPASAEHAHSVTAPSPTLDQFVSIEDTVHGHPATELAFPGIVFPSPPEHAHSVTAPTLSLSGEVGVEDTEHAQAVTSPEVTLSFTIALNNAQHGHEVTRPAFPEATRPSRFFAVEEEELYFSVAHETTHYTVTRTGSST